MSKSVWETLSSENTILFLVSGFSMEAQNKTGGDYLNGPALAKALSNSLGYPPEENLTLPEVSEDFLPNREELLNRTLQPLMTTTRVSANQLDIASRRWRRVYTTNYDDVFEFAMAKNGIESETITFDSTLKKQRTLQQVIHLHGSIHDCEDHNVDSRLILTQSSYDRQLANPRPWFDEFVNDIRFSQAVVFLGYSMSDVPIRALLLSDPEIKAKTYFVTRDAPTGRFGTLIQKYGEVKPISTDGLCKHLAAVAQSTPSRTPRNFLAFTELNPKRDGQPFVPATSIEVRNLLLTGRFNQKACAASWPKSDYLIPRKDKIDEAISSFSTSKTILVHSRIGNGKSLFTQMLAIALSQKGYRCIRAKSSAEITNDDKALLKSTQRLVLMFSNLDDAVNVLMQMETPPRHDMRFVVEVSSSLADVRANSFNHHLIKPFHRVDLNSLNAQDVTHFEEILNLAGIRPPNFDEFFSGCQDVRDFLLRLYKNEKIQTKIISHARPLLDLPQARRAMISAFTLKSLELDVSPDFKRELIGADPISSLEVAMKDHSENVLDFFDFRDSSIEPFSSIVSEFLLQEFLTPDDVLDWALKAATVSARRKQEQLESGQLGKRFQEAKMVLGRVMQITRLKALVRNPDDLEARLSNFFEQARQVPEINLEPLFWLQFSILGSPVTANENQLLTSLDRMRTAYQRADDIERFEKFQLDTHLMRLLLRIETQRGEQAEKLEYWDEILDLFSNFESMITDNGHRDFVVRVLEGVESFCRTRSASFTLRQRQDMIGAAGKLADALDLLSDAQKISSNVEPVRHSLMRAADFLSRTTPPHAPITKP